MPSNKDRLYIGLYARGGSPTMPNREDTYHWALIVGPKAEAESGTGTQFHAKEKVTGPGNIEWFFEELDVPLTATNMLLVRIAIAKIEKRKRVGDILRKVPVRQGTSGWNCVGWVKEALELLKVDDKALGTNVIKWEKVRNAAMSYCEEKKGVHRFDGRGNFDTSRPPTYDLMEDKEVIP